MQALDLSRFLFLARTSPQRVSLDYVCCCIHYVDANTCNRFDGLIVFHLLTITLQNMAATVRDIKAADFIQKVMGTPSLLEKFL
jgi:hypothetical protein